MARRILLRMQSAEIELKFPVSDPSQLESRLPGLGFHLDTTRRFEHNTLYDSPERELRDRHEILRIRQYGEICTLTHKRMPGAGDPPETSGYKVRIETETTVADGDALGEVFKRLGYAPAFVYEKYRTEWSQATGTGLAHLVIDETPIGIWAELEGPVAWIDRTLETLGIDPGSCLTESYGRLFSAWKERTASPAQNLSFAEIGSAMVSQ